MMNVVIRAKYIVNYHTPLPLSRGECVVEFTRIGTFLNRPEAKPNGAKLKSYILLKRCYNQQGQTSHHTTNTHPFAS